MLVIAACLVGCKNAEELVFTDSAQVSAIRFVNERFQNLLLGSPANPYSGQPALILRVPGWSECQIGRSLEGELMRRCNAADHVDASDKCGIGPHPGRGPRSGHATWGKGAMWVSLLPSNSNIGSIDIVIRGTDVLGVSIYCAPAEGPPIEVKVAGSAWQSFPLDRAALTTLFGQPKDSHQWWAE